MYKAICFGNWDCSMNLFAMIAIFFASAILSRQLSELADMDFNVIGSTALGLITFTVIFTFFGTLKFSFLGGLVALLVGGFLGGQILGGSN